MIALLWGVASRQHWMSEQILPAPALVWQSALEFGSGELWGHLWISLQRLFWGLAAGIASGLLLGVWLGASRRAQTLVLPTFVALAQVPTLAWIPLFMLFFGIGELLKLVVLVKAVVVPVTLHTLVGVRDAQPKLREAAAALRLPKHLLFLRLLLPAALPAFLTGVRLALATGWTSLLAVELLASSEGIGYLMVWGRQLFMLDLVMLCILVIGLVGAALERSFSALEKRLLYWPQPATGEQQRGPLPRGWQSLLLPLGIVVLWQASNSFGWVDPNILTSPLEVVRTLLVGLADGSLPQALLLSLQRTLSGLLLGGAAGLLAGLLLGLSNTAERLFGPSLSALRQVALFAWVPLLTAWFGLGEGAKLVFVGLAAFFPLLIATQRGIASLSPQLGEAARTLRLNLWQRRPAPVADLRLAGHHRRGILHAVGRRHRQPDDRCPATVPHGPGDGCHGPDRPGRRPARHPWTTPRIARYALENRMNAFNTAHLQAANQPNSTPPLVSFEGVGKVFSVDGQPFEAIRNFNLSINEGEFIAIVGASGCGKSTLLRLLVGLDTEYSGSIRVDGQAVSGIGGERGIVFQEHRLFPWLNVEQNIALGLVNESLTQGERARRVHEFVQLVGLVGFESAYPHQLSGGMAQRVAIARGLVASPRILLLDEPFGALDALTRQQLQDELLAIRERAGITTLLVTHDAEEATYLADRVVVLEPRPGRIKSVVEIDLPHPRLRTGVALHGLREKVLHQITGDGGYLPPPGRRVEGLRPELIAL
jgi:sulfonate transport system permease protein